MKSSGKNFIIAFLMVLAIYQTAELWFEDFSGHNFFSFISKADATVEKAGAVNHIVKRIIINTGDNKLICKADNIDAAPYKQTADGLITRLLKKGQVTAEGDTDWKQVLEGRCLIYQYGSTLGGSQAAELFAVPQSNTAKIKAFDTVVLSYGGSNAKPKLRFINSRSDWCLEIMVNDNGLTSEVNALFKGLNLPSEQLYYISSVQNGFEIFKDNEFIPHWDGQWVSLGAITAHSQYEGAEGKNRLEGDVNSFFANPAGKWTSNLNGIISYSDESTVVKYYPKQVLEYSGYSTQVYEGSNTFYINYLAALNILERDKGVENEPYLKYYKTEGSRFVMGFGYRINDMPVEMSDELKQQTGMEDFIEIYAEMGRVTRYRRCCRSFEAANGHLSLSTDFLSAVDKVYSDLEDDSGAMVDSLQLAYVDGQTGNPGVKWIIEINGEEYILEAAG